MVLHCIGWYWMVCHSLRWFGWYGILLGVEDIRSWYEMANMKPIYSFVFVMRHSGYMYLFNKDIQKMFLVPVRSFAPTGGHIVN